MRKKIVIFTYSLAGGGAERMVANMLHSLNREKYEIHPVLMNTNIAYTIPEDQHIHFIEKSNPNEPDLWKLIKLPFLAYRFSRYCKKNEIELVFALMNRPNMVATMARWFGLKAKVLISERFYTPYFYNNLTLAGRFKTMLLKKCYGMADCIMPNSQGTIDALQNEFNIKTDYKLIKNTTDIQAIKKLRHEPVDEPVDFKKFTFVNVSAFRSEKNHELLVDAVAELKDRDFQLILIGKGVLLNQVKEKVNRLGLEKKILFFPFADNPFKYLYRSSCFITSSLTEGFPNILIESMICDLPIIAADCKTGPRELLAPETNLHTVVPEGTFEIAKFGLLCAINSRDSLVSAMKWALDNPEKLKKLCENTAPEVAGFDYQKVADELSLAIDQYLEGSIINTRTATVKPLVENNSPVIEKTG